MRVFFVGALLCTPLALAAEFTDARLGAALSFDQAARKTLAAHPQFQQFSLALEAARARETQAQLRPPLELSGSLENVLGSGDAAALKGAELTVSLGSVLERGDQREARLGVAQSASALLGVQQRIQALDLIAETGTSFVAVAVAQESLGAAVRAQALAKSALDTITARVAAAQSPQTEQLNAEIVHVETMLQAGNAKRRLAAAQQGLALNWNDPDALPSVSMTLFDLPKPTDAKALLALLDTLPDVAQYTAETRVAEAELALAQSQAQSDWRWSAGVRRLEASNDQALVVGVSIPLGLKHRSLSFVQEAERNAAAPGLAAQGARLRLKKLLFATLTQMQSAIAEEQAVRDHQLPQAQQVMTLTLAGYELGRYDYRDVALAQSQLQTLAQKRLNAAQSYHLARIELERLTGAQLPLISE